MSVQTQIDRINSAKTAIGAAIAGKGVTVPSGTKIDGMAALIGAIEAGGGSVQFHMQTWTPAEDVKMGNIEHGAGFAPDIALVLSPAGWPYYGDGTRKKAVGIFAGVSKSLANRLNLDDSYGRKAFLTFNSYNGAVGAANPSFTETYIDTVIGTGNKYYAGQTYSLFLIKVG